jgi:hypothetical protein
MLKTTLGVVTAAIALCGCGGGGSEPLTPARQLAGTFATTGPVAFNLETDFCGSRATIGVRNSKVTWIITPVEGFSNVVDVEMRHQVISTSSLSCGGYVPLVSPTFFRLCISSSSFTPCSGQNLNVGYATGSFTTDLIQATWLHYECLIYCFGERTQANAIKLSRQS